MTGRGGCFRRTEVCVPSRIGRCNLAYSSTSLAATIKLGLSREKASELLETIPPEKIERIESGKFTAYPDEVLAMAEKYGAPNLCNYYCANECEIGKQYVPEVKIRHLSQIVLEMLASLNSVKNGKTAWLRSPLTAG